MRNLKKSFTLIEILIVSTIVGIIVSIGGITAQKAYNKSKISRAKTDLRDIKIGISRLAIDTFLLPGRLPLEPCVHNPEVYVNTCQAGLLSECTPGNYPNWNGPYIQAGLSEDPWGTSYYFDPDYACRPDVHGCEGVRNDSSDAYGPYRSVRALVSFGADKVEQYCTPGSGGGSPCVRRDRDNVVLVLCEQ